MFVLAGLGAAFDISTGDGLRKVFTISLCVAAGLAAATVHREDLAAAVLAVPFVYTVIVVFSARLDGAAGGSSTISLGTLLLNAAPSLMFAVACGFVVAVVRFVGGRGRHSGRRIVTYR